MCPYAGDVLPTEATLYYHGLSLPTRRLLDEISVMDKEERTVDVLFKDGDRTVDVTMRLLKRYMYGDSCDETLDREELPDMPGLMLTNAQTQQVQGQHIPLPEYGYQDHGCCCPNRRLCPSKTI